MPHFRRVLCTLRIRHSFDSTSLDGQSFQPSRESSILSFDCRVSQLDVVRGWSIQRMCKTLIFGMNGNTSFCSHCCDYRSSASPDIPWSCSMIVIVRHTRVVVVMVLNNPGSQCRDCTYRRGMPRIRPRAPTSSELTNQGEVRLVDLRGSIPPTSIPSSIKNGIALCLGLPRSRIYRSILLSTDTYKYQRSRFANTTTLIS
jgi:hypothetical protein